MSTTQNIQIRKAERKRSKLRLGLAGPSGSGKTYSALKLAKGLGGKVCMIDTEHGSGDLYADLADYDIITLQPPYAPKNYLDAIRAAEDAGYDVIIIDSLSHAWQDEGGLLDQADKKQSSTDRFRVWAELTPQHRSLVNAMLNSPAHIIGTMRSKQGYSMEQDPKTGKTSIKKLGLAPVQREGMEYEFTVFMDIDQNHVAQTTKDRTAMFDNEAFQIDEKTGERILNWLNSGKPDPKLQKREIVRQLRRLDLDIPEDRNDAAEFVRFAVGKLTGIELNGDEEKLDEVIEALKGMTDKEKAHALVYPERKPPGQDAESRGEDAETEAAEANDEKPQAEDPDNIEYPGEQEVKSGGTTAGSSTTSPDNTADEAKQ